MTHQLSADDAAADELAVEAEQLLAILAAGELQPSTAERSLHNAAALQLGNWLARATGDADIAARAAWFGQQLVDAGKWPDAEMRSRRRADVMANYASTGLLASATLEAKSAISRAMARRLDRLRPAPAPPSAGAPPAPDESVTRIALPLQSRSGPQSSDSETPLARFEAACGRGVLVEALAIARAARLTVSTIRTSSPYTALQRACERGHLHVAKQLVADYGRDVWDVRAAECAVFETACSNGHLPTARWLAETFDLTVADARAGNCRALRFASRYGDLAMVQWLAETFGLTAADARSCGIESLWVACANGHLAVVQYLAEKFELNAKDARICGNYPLQQACAGGHLPVAQYLVARFGLTAQDARSDGNATLHGACLGGHGATARWLVETFGLTAVDARVYDNAMLGYACFGRHWAVALWLVETFELGAPDANGRCRGAICAALGEGDVEALRLAEALGLAEALRPAAETEQ